MSDPTTDGLAATPAEIEGMVRNLCAYALGEPDPIQRYEGLSHQQALFEGMVEAIRRARGRLVADLVVAGLSVTEIAAQTSLGTVVKVRKLISLAGETQRVQEATAARKAAFRREEATEKAMPGGDVPASEASTAGLPERATERAPAEAAQPQGAERHSAQSKPVHSESVEPHSAGVQWAEPYSELSPSELPPHLAAPNGKRLLTPADRAALGLPVESTPVGQEGRGVETGGRKDPRPIGADGRRVITAARLLWRRLES